MFEKIRKMAIEKKRTFRQLFILGQKSPYILDGQKKASILDLSKKGQISLLVFKAILLKYGF
jgi:hypothetical protein